MKRGLRIQPLTVKSRMSNTINQTYSLAALLIHATKQEVTKDKIQSIFKTLGVEFSPKIASFFELSADKFSSIITNIGSSSAAPSASASCTAAAKEEEAPKEEESSSQDLGLDF